jgi:hypothetical protein
MRNTVVVTGGKPIAVLLQSISGVSAINPLVVFYDIHERNREILFFYFSYIFYITDLLINIFNVCTMLESKPRSLAWYASAP